MTFALLASMSAMAQADGRNRGNDQYTARLKSELSLTDDQEAKMREINKKYREEYAKSRQERHEKDKQMFEAREKEVKEALTQEQYAKLQAMRAERHKKSGLKEKAGLTDEEAKRVESINKATWERMRELRASSGMTRESAKEVMNERDAKLREALPKDKYEKVIAVEKERMNDRRGEKGHFKGHRGHRR